MRPVCELLYARRVTFHLDAFPVVPYVLLETLDREITSPPHDILTLVLLSVTYIDGQL